MTGPAALTIRPATPEDLAECAEIWREALNDYFPRVGAPQIPPTPPPPLVRLHAHIRETDPERFLVAERAGPGPRLVGFGCATVRGRLWFLSMLFVRPAEQARGLGRAILQRLLPDPADGWTLATATDAAQPISNALYAGLGMIPRVPLFEFEGRPRDGWTPAPLPAGFRRDDAAPQEEVDVLDGEVLGFVHPQDHAFLLGERRLRVAVRDAAGRLAGYGYAAPSGRIGPLVVADPALVVPLIGALITAVQPGGIYLVLAPGPLDGVWSALLDAGFRIDGFPVLLCWNRPFIDLTRAIPISPGLL